MIFSNFIVVERLLHSLKTAIAVGIACLLVWLTGRQADQWVVISVIVVMCGQIYVGSIMQKAYYRLFGTLVGCLAAALTLHFLPNSYFAILVTIALVSSVFSYVATSYENLNQMGTLGAVTTVIVLFSTPPSVSFAFTRFLEISLGIMIATLVSQFIFPINARTHLRRSQAATVSQIRDYYTAVVTNRFRTDTHINSSDLDEGIIATLLKQRQLAKESARELIGKRFDPAHFAHSLYCEREILRAINFMDMALGKIGEIKEIFNTQNPLDPFNNAVTEALEILARVLKTNKVGNAHIHLPDLKAVSSALHKLTDLMNSNQHIYLDGFVFSAEILVSNLRALAVLNGIPVSPEPLPA